MNHSAAVILLASLLAAGPVAAEDFTIQPGDTLARTVALQKGKTVTLKLVSGEELTGTVKMVTDAAAQLSGLAGKEYFDGVVPIDKIEAMLIRTK
jgi:hypothetical protein